MRSLYLPRWIIWRRCCGKLRLGKEPNGTIREIMGVNKDIYDVHLGQEGVRWP